MHTITVGYLHLLALACIMGVLGRGFYRVVCFNKELVMTVVGYGLFAVAISILVSTWIFHRDVVKVYYPKKGSWTHSGTTTGRYSSASPNSLEESWDELEESLGDQE